MSIDLRDKICDFQRDGVAVFPNVLDKSIVSKLRQELVQAISDDEINRPDVFDSGMIHNCMFRGDSMRALLDCQIMNDFVSLLLSDTFIVYAYQSSSLIPESGGVNYGSRPHVDSPRFIENYITNVGVIFALDDFTKRNGATYYRPGSHLSEELVDDQDFYKEAQRATCKAGDMIVFHGRLHHAAGKNVTEYSRNALTINFCRSFMRQRFDFPKMVSFEEEEKYSINTKKLLGWNVRVPKSLDEFYLSERLYKSNQG